MPAALALAIDVLAVVLFTVLGRRSHDEALGLSGIVKVAAPFVLALLVGWAASRAWRRPLDLRRGIVVWVVTVALGMVLRHTVFDRSTAASFVVVATVFLGLFLLGWRLVARRILARRQPVTSASR